MGQVTTIPADALIVGEVKVPTGDAEIPAYRAMPDHCGPLPTVLVVHEIFGVHEYIKDICRASRASAITRSRRSFSHDRAMRRANRTFRRL